MYLKVIDVFDVGGDVFVGGVDQGLVQINEKNEPAVLH
jgi:hypothetical protein